MEEMTFKQKQAHYKKIQRLNYLASLRLEGFDTKPVDTDNPLSTREAILAKYLLVQDGCDLLETAQHVQLQSPVDKPTQPNQAHS